jgi:hypothetical protein
VLVIVCLESTLASCIPCLVGALPHGAVAPMRVRATTIISYLVIQFRSLSVQSTLSNRAGDNKTVSCNFINEKGEFYMAFVIIFPVYWVCSTYNSTPNCVRLITLSLFVTAST